MKKRTISLLLIGLITLILTSVAPAACTNTTFLGLCKGALDDPNWHTLLNENFDLIDKLEQSYTVANLPTSCTEGEKARVTDGGAAGSTVQCDADGVTWRCEDEYTKKILNPYCPPYNAKADATDGTNHAALQAVCTRAVTFGSGDVPSFWTIDLGPDVLTINSTVECDNATSSTLLTIQSNGHGGLKFTNAGESYGLIVGGTTTGNNLVLRNLTLHGNGASDGPDKLLYLDRQVQVLMDGLKIADASLDGVYMKSVGHVRAVNNLCTENAVHDADGSCFALDGTNVDVVFDNNNIEGAVAGSLATFVRIATNSTTVAGFQLTNTNHRGTSWYSMVAFNKANISVTRMILANNTAMQLQHSGFNLGATGTSTISGIIAQNILLGCDSGCATELVGIRLFDTLDLVVTDNHIEGFPKGINLNGTTENVRLIDNKMEVGTHGVHSEFTTTNLVIDGLEVDGASTGDVVTAGTSGGGNAMRNVWSSDGSPPIFDLTGWRHETDSIEYAPRVQTETCADNTVGSSPQTLTLNPYYQFIKVTNADPDSCDITMGETNGTNGAKFNLVVVADGASTVDFADTAGVSELAGAFSAGVWDSIAMEYTGATTPDRWVETSRSDN